MFTTHEWMLLAHINTLFRWMIQSISSSFSDNMTFVFLRSHFFNKFWNSKRLRLLLIMVCESDLFRDGDRSSCFTLLILESSYSLSGFIVHFTSTKKYHSAASTELLRAWNIDHAHNTTCTTTTMKFHLSNTKRQKLPRLPYYLPAPSQQAIPSNVHNTPSTSYYHSEMQAESQ